MMGGSGGGGGGYFPRKPRTAEVDKLVREAQERAARDKQEAEANQQLLSLLARFNDRDVETVRERLDIIEGCLGDEIDLEAVLFGGSVAKHTYVDGLSDIDALVVLDSGTDDPRELRKAFRQLLERTLPMGQVEGIREGDLAVTVTFTDGMEVQLLPAKRYGEELAISDATGEVWSRIDPAAFGRALTKVNQLQAGAVVPSVKLAKSMISNLPKDRRLTGYHLEALAVEVFRTYDGRKTPVAMLRHFFSEASERVRAPISDVTGQSSTVDAYLGEAGSVARKLVSDSLATISRQLHSASSADRWKELVAGE